MIDVRQALNSDRTVMAVINRSGDEVEARVIGISDGDEVDLEWDYEGNTFMTSRPVAELLDAWSE